MVTTAFDEIKAVFRGMFIRDLRRVESRDGVCLGDDIRIHKDKGRFVIRYSPAMRHLKRKRIEERLDLASIQYVVQDDFTL